MMHEFEDPLKLYFECFRNVFIIVLVCIRSNLNGEKLDYTHFKFESLITYFIADCEPVEKQSEMYSPFVCFLTRHTNAS